MRQLVFLLEELSARRMIEGLLPKLLPNHVDVRFIVFDGKQDLEKQLIAKLKGYLVPDARFFILRDQDAEDCRDVKQRLQTLCQASGKTTCVVRIACHELESWYLADLVAVEQALDLKNLAHQQTNKKFRAPDRLSNASEELIMLTGGVYQKVQGSKLIGPFLDINNRRSKSYAHFVESLNSLSRELYESTDDEELPDAPQPQ